MKKKLLLAFVVGGAAGVVAGCQTYDFEPVEPLAVAQTTQSRTVSGQQAKPNLMFLIDKSGSMKFPADESVAPCTAGCGLAGNCDPNCRTRIDELRTAMTTFLSTNGTIAWMGMAIYPTRTGDLNCGATGFGDVVVPLEPKETDLAADLNGAAMAVSAEIQKLTNITVLGGTPTGDSLKFLGNYEPLLDPNPRFLRQDFIVLLTDGLPNCNDDPITQPNHCSVNGNPNPACKCTLGTCRDGDPNFFCRKGCLDSLNAAGQVAALRAPGKDIKTIVIGFGADTAMGDGPATLNAMAEAGGFARTCPGKTDAECGANNTCNVATGTCARSFYQATSAQELGEALAAISKALDPKDLCNYMLTDIPTDEKYLAVIIDGKNEPAGNNTWTYSAGTVAFNGALCAKVAAANQANPVQVEFRIVNKL